MSQKVLVTLTDDLTTWKSQGKKVVPADTTIQFSFEGADYEIDLSGANAQKFANTIEPYRLAGRRVTLTHNGHQGKKPRSKQSRVKSAEVRAWAIEQGIELAERGRIPADVVEKYEAAH